MNYTFTVGIKTSFGKKDAKTVVKGGGKWAFGMDL